MGLLYVNSMDIDGLLYSIMCDVSMDCMTLSVSMYLMMDHNEKHYEKFLKVIKILNLNILCFKSRNNFVSKQLALIFLNIKVRCVIFIIVMLSCNL